MLKMKRMLFVMMTWGGMTFGGMGLVQAQTASTSPTTAGAVGDGAIMSAVPAEAWAAVLVKNMNASSKIVDDYGKKLGLGTPAMEKWLTRTLGIGGQLDMANPIVLVVMSKERFGDEPIALVVKVKDYEKFAADLKGETTETAGVMKGTGEAGSVYFGKKGTFLIVAPTEGITKAVIGSKQGFSATMGASAQKMLNESDVYARVNVPSLNQFLKPTLMGIGAMMQMGAMGGMGGMGGDNNQGADAKSQAQMQAMQSAGAVINALVGFLDETEGLDIGLKLDAKEIRAGFMVDFKADQEISKILTAQKMTNEPLIRGLAGDDFVVAMGYQWDSKKMCPFQQAMLQINPGFTDPTDFDKYKAVNTQIASMQLGQSVKINLLKAQPGKPLFEVQQVTETTDSKKLIGLTRQMFELQAKIKSATGKPEFKIQEGAVTVDGVSVDQVTIDLNSIFAMPGLQPEQTKELKSILGTLLGGQEKTVTIMMAPVTEKQVAVYFGGDQTGLSKFIQAVKSNATPLAKNAKVAEVAKLLPKQRVMEGYLDLGKLASGFMAIAMTAGGEGKDTPTTFPVIETPLVGSTVVVEGTSVKMDVVMPLDVVSKMMSLRYMIPMPGTNADESGDDKEELDSDDDSSAE